MSSALDYERIAHLYDSYLQFTDDLPFFRQQCQSGAVLELMCGTGRISIPLLEAGVNLTCTDASPAMLAIFQDKLMARGLSAPIVQADVTDLDWQLVFDLVLLPFQSFHELCTEVEQRKALAGIAQALKPNGHFICTLHNPKVRLQAIGKAVSHYGPFPRVDGIGFVSLSVDLNYDPATETVRGWQTVYELDAVEHPIAEHRLAVQFRLITLEDFQTLLESSGFLIEEVFGNYDYSLFAPETSPYMIISARKIKTF